MNIDGVIATIIQGLIVSGIGAIAYSSGRRWFKIAGEGDFDSKEVAQGWIVALVFITGLISGPLFQELHSVTLGLSTLQEIAVVTVVSRILVNTIVDDWNMFDDKSTFLYVMGVILFSWHRIPDLDSIISQFPV